MNTKFSTLFFCVFLSLNTADGGDCPYSFMVKNRTRTNVTVYHSYQENQKIYWRSIASIKQNETKEIVCQKDNQLFFTTNDNDNGNILSIKIPYNFNYKTFSVSVYQTTSKEQFLTLICND